MSKKSKILTYLQKGKTITPAKAQIVFGAWRLADIVYKLKQEGHKIITTIKRAPNGVTYAEYKYQGD